MEGGFFLLWCLSMEVLGWVEFSVPGTSKVVEFGFKGFLVVSGGFWDLWKVCLFSFSGFSWSFSSLVVLICSQPEEVIEGRDEEKKQRRWFFRG